MQRDYEAHADGTEKDEKQPLDGYDALPDGLTLALVYGGGEAARPAKTDAHPLPPKKTTAKILVSTFH